MAVFIIECSYLAHVAAIELNDNNLSMSCWALTVLFFYFAVTREKLIYWLLIGVAGGIAVMTKYSAVFLFAAMFFYLISGRDTRKYFKTPAPYLTAAVAALFVIPHLAWLVIFVALGPLCLILINSLVSGTVPLTHVLSHYSKDHPKSFVYRAIVRKKEVPFRSGMTEIIVNFAFIPPER